MKHLSVAVLLTLAVASPAHAEDPDDQKTVITAERATGTVFDAPRTIHAVGAEALELRMPSDIPDALEGIPGVHVQRTNRGAAAPLLRGHVGPANLILVDGVRFNTSIFRTGPNQYAALLDPGLLQSAEVLLGPGSVLYGSDAMGGTLGYRTRAVPTREGVGGHLDLSADSADLSLRAAATGELRSGDVGGWLRVGGRLRSTLRTGDGEEVALSDNEQLDWGTKWQWTPSRDLRLTATYVGTWLDDAGRIDGLPRGDVRLYDTRDHFGVVRAEHRLRGGFLRLVEVTAGLHHLTDVVDRWRCEKDGDGAVLDRAGCIGRDPNQVTRTSINRDSVTALSVSAIATGRALDDRLLLKLGLDARHEWISSGRDDDASARGTFSDGSTAGAAELFTLAEARPYLDEGTFELIVTGAVRASAVFAAAPDVPGLGDVSYDHLGLVGGGSVRGLIANRVNVYGGVWQGFRAPNLQETTALGDTGQTFEVPNGDLDPERTTTVEGGVKLALGVADVGVSVFYDRTTDAIVRESATFNGAAIVDGKDVVRRTNATHRETWGVEGAARVRLTDDLRVAATIASIDGDVHTQDGATEAPRRLPPLQGSARVSWSPLPELTVSADVLWAAAQRRLAPGDTRDLRICGDPAAPHTLQASCAGTNAYATLGFGAALDLSETVALRLRVDNALDADYRVHGSGYDAPGISARMGLRVTLR